jgi:hypothetical protein
VFHLMAASKKGVSAKQVQRMCGFASYKTAWFMCHLVREAMKPDAKAGPLGGPGKVLESDETFVGGSKKNVHRGKPEPKKHPVHALVERGGQVRARRVPGVTARTLRSALEKAADRRSKLHTDDSLANLSVGKDFAEHRTVAHTLGEYVSKDGQAHTQTAESFFSLIKRGITGSFHSVSEQHLGRYVDEFAYRWNTRSALGIEDTERASRMIKDAVGKRLTYRQPDSGRRLALCASDHGRKPAPPPVTRIISREKAEAMRSASSSLRTSSGHAMLALVLGLICASFASIPSGKDHPSTMSTNSGVVLMTCTKVCPTT